MKTLPENKYLLDDASQLIQKKFKAIRQHPLMPSVGAYNLSISHQYKFIWFRVAKVGTRTILGHFKNNGVTLDVDHASWIHFPVNEYKDYYKFAFVRNPWDRLASCWRNKVLEQNFFEFEPIEYEKMKSFENFVKYISEVNVESFDRHIRPQTSLIDINALDFLGRMENFDKDACNVFSSLGMPEHKIIPANVTSNSKNYQKYYSDELAEIVQKIYQKDIQVFGYKFD